MTTGQTLITVAASAAVFALVLGPALLGKWIQRRSHAATLRAVAEHQERRELALRDARDQNTFLDEWEAEGTGLLSIAPAHLVVADRPERPANVASAAPVTETFSRVKVIGLVLEPEEAPAVPELLAVTGRGRQEDTITISKPVAPVAPEADKEALAYMAKRRRTAERAALTLRDPDVELVDDLESAFWADPLGSWQLPPEDHSGYLPLADSVVLDLAREGVLTGVGMDIEAEWKDWNLKMEEITV